MYSFPRHGQLALVVEDNADVREVMEGILASAGFRTLGARHGLEAMQLLAQGERPAVVVLDLMMPVMDGWRFVEQVRSIPHLANLPVVAVSALHVGHGGRHDVDAFVPKPLEPVTLLTGVERAIAIRASHGATG